MHHIKFQPHKPQKGHKGRIKKKTMNEVEKFRKSLDRYWNYLDSVLRGERYRPFTRDLRKGYMKRNGVYLISETPCDHGIRYIGKSSMDLLKQGCNGLYGRLGSHWTNIDKGFHHRKESTRQLFREGKGAERFWVKVMTNSMGLLEGMEEGYEKHLIGRYKGCNLINKNQ